MHKVITFLTGNPHKAELVSRYLDYPVQHYKVDLPEIQSLNLVEVVHHKARAAHEHVGDTVLVEDVALCITALGQLPGPFIKWFLHELGNEGICSLLKEDHDRSARAEIVFGLYDGKEMRHFGHTIEGAISMMPEGDEGFGWDAIFIPQGYTKTRAAMSEEERDASSLRQPALAELKRYLRTKEYDFSLVNSEDN